MMVAVTDAGTFACTFKVALALAWAVADSVASSVEVAADEVGEVGSGDFGCGLSHPMSGGWYIIGCMPPAPAPTGAVGRCRLVYVGQH